jgi:hypothetical protein
MLKCYAVRHEDDDNLAQRFEHAILELIASDVCIEFEPGFAGNSYLSMPLDERLRQAVEARMAQNHLKFRVVTRIAY